MDGKVGFVGAGNMAGAMVRALVTQGVLDGGSIMAINKSNRPRMEALRETYGIEPAPDMPSMLSRCPVIVIAVKPHQVSEAMHGARDFLTYDHLVISVAAGVSLGSLRALLGDRPSVVRAMPNTPVQVSEGVVALTAAASVPDEKRALAHDLFRAVGKVFWVEERLMDAITALSGSGPAYFYRLAEEMARAAEKLGLDGELAAELSRQTLVGAGSLLKQSTWSVTELLNQVVSPNGTTEAALKEMDARQFALLVDEAMARAAGRSRELGKRN
jgi:pyrroline-5-carboxylate reductase